MVKLSKLLKYICLIFMISILSIFVMNAQYTNKNKNSYGSEFVDKEAQKILKSYLYLQSTASKMNVYKSEAFILDYRFFVHPDIILEEMIPESMQIQKGFITLEKDLGSLSYSKTEVNGVEMKTSLLKRLAMIPTQSGNIQIDKIGFSFKTKIPLSEEYAGGNLRYKEYDYKTYSNDLIVNVKELPTPPNGFSGAVGKFKIELSSDDKKIQVNTPFYVYIKIYGLGQLNTSIQPKLDLPYGVKVLNKNVSDSMVIDKTSIYSMKFIKVALTAEINGIVSLSLHDFICFDPEAEKYYSAACNKIAVEAFGEFEKGRFNISSSSDNQDYTEPHSNYTIYIYIILIVTIISAVFLFFFIRNLRKKKNTKNNYQMNMPKHKFNQNTEYIESIIKAGLYVINDKKRYLEIVSNSLKSYFNDRYECDVSDSDENEIRIKVYKETSDKELTEKWIVLQKTCEYMRFWHNPEEFDLELYHNKLVETIKETELILSNRHK